jgi:hypothetical protein
LPSGELVGKSPGTDEGNGDGRAASGVTAGPGAFIGRGDFGAAARGGSFVLAARRRGLALRAGFRATFFFRAEEARCFLPTVAPRRFAFATFFFALRFFAIIASKRI